MLLCKVNHFHRLVFAFIQIPDLEVFGGVNHEELTKAVHQATPQIATFIITVIVNETPVYHNYWVLAGIVPNGDRRSILVVVDPRYSNFTQGQTVTVLTQLIHMRSLQANNQSPTSIKRSEHLNPPKAALLEPSNLFGCI